MNFKTKQISLQRRLLTLLCLLMIGNTAFAQVDYSVGTGTAGNTSSTYPCPIQDWYEGSRAQYLYTASELTALGMGAGNVTAVKFNIVTLGAAGVVEGYTIKITGTSVSSLSATTWEPGAVTVYGPVNYTPVAGVNTFTFTTPFSWNGSDNILVEICNGDATNTSLTTYTENPIIPWTTGLTFNGSHTYRSDNLGGLCGTTTTTNNGTMTTRPNITFTGTASGQCSGTPTGGTAVSSSSSVCTGASFTLGVTGASVGGGLSYQWEWTTIGNNSWTPIAGATGASYSTTQQIGYEYRRIITCGNKTSISSPVTVNQNAFTECYCSSIPTSGIDEEIYSVTINGDNSNTFSGQGNGCAAGTVAPGPGSIQNRYSNWKTLGSFTSMMEASTVTFDIEQDECDAGTYYPNGIAIWIDLNQDGVFDDATEKMFVTPTTATGPRHVTGSFTIPVGTPTGVTGMRVISAENYSGASLTSCLAYGYGETEDFLVTITAAIPCSGTPATPTASASAATVCPSNSFTLSASGATSGGGITYQWQSSANGTSGWSSIAAGTTANFTTTQSAATYYRLKTTCTNSNSTSTSNVVAVGVNPFMTCYCTTSNAGSSLITEVKVRDQAVNTSASQPAASPYYTALYTADTFQVRQGASVPFTVSIDNSFGAVISVWVDYNQDGAFSASEHQQVALNAPVGSSTQIMLNVPATATLGVTQMRVRSRNTGNPNGPGDACLTMGSGETEEYLVNISKACTKLPKTAGAISVDPNVNVKVCPGDTRTYTIAAWSSDADSYNWTAPVGATIVSGQGTNTVTVSFGAGYTVADTLRVVAVNGCGSSATERKLVVALRGAPNAGSISVNTSDKVCPGETRLYSIAAVPDATNYVWTAPTGATVTSGQGTNSVVVTYGAGFTADGSISVVAENGCGTGTPKTLSVKYKGVPKAPTAILGNLYGVCGSTSEPYSVAPVAGANSYNWTTGANASVATGQGTTNVTVSFGGSFTSTTVSVATENGCGVSATTKTITVKSAPNKPVISGPNTACAGSTKTYTLAPVYGATGGYTWSASPGSAVISDGVNSGNPLTTTATSVTVTWGSAVSKVMATANNVCDTSAKATKTVTDCAAARTIAEEGALSVELLPNPATDQVTIRVNNTEEGSATVRILSMTGQQLMSEVMPSAQHGQIVLPISNLATGMYMVEVTVNGQKMTKQLIKN